MAYCTLSFMAKKLGFEQVEGLGVECARAIRESVGFESLHGEI
jgi:hypothetical protein